MKKKVSLNNKKIKTIIQRTLGSKLSVSESKIDSIIKEYLSERTEYEYDSDYIEKTTFSPKSIEVLESMSSGINEMLEDLDIIKEKEGDVLVYNDQYADEVLSYYIRDLQGIMEDLNDLISITRENSSKDEPNQY